METCLEDSSQNEKNSEIKPPLIPFPSMGPKYNWFSGPKYFGIVQIIEFTIEKKNGTGPRVFGLAKNSFLTNRKTVHKYFCNKAYDIFVNL